MTPLVLSRPRLGFRPQSLLNIAGTRPDPAVSVPKENVANPSESETAEPALEPPGTAQEHIWIPRHSKRRPHADEPRGKLIKVRLAFRGIAPARIRFFYDRTGSRQACSDKLHTRQSSECPRGRCYP